MKTNYFIMAMLLLLSVTSCSTYYRMSSRIEKDGSIYREIYAQGDSAFLAGDKTHNPFLFIFQKVFHFLPFLLVLESKNSLITVTHIIA